MLYEPGTLLACSVDALVCSAAVNNEPRSDGLTGWWDNFFCRLEIGWNGWEIGRVYIVGAAARLNYEPELYCELPFCERLNEWT